MKIHEYQGKAILKKYGVTVPRGTMATSREEAEAAARELLSSGATGVVVKAQIHAGGRGKGGGVKIAKSVSEAGDLAEKMLGMKLVTHQTGPEGRTVRRLLIEETLPIDKELYLGILVDRTEGKPVFMASAAGGMEIEQVAAENPDAILKQHIDPGMGLEAFQARKMAFKLGLSAKQINPAVQFLSNLYKAFLDTDASLLEINPFITTTDGRLFALDAKLTFDDNALFRHPDIRELRDITEEDPLEVEASKYSLNYIKLDGSVGCMVNGAGLAMATMDIIKYAGGMPANFLDGFLHGVENGPALVRRATLARRYAADDLSSVGRAGLGVEGAFASGQALHDQAGFLVNQDCHKYDSSPHPNRGPRPPRCLPHPSWCQPPRS